MKLDSGVLANDLMKIILPKGGKTEPSPAHEFKLELANFIGKPALEQIETDVGDQDANDFNSLEHFEIDEAIIQDSTVTEEQENLEAQENTDFIEQPKILKLPEKYINYYPVHSAIGHSFTIATQTSTEISGVQNNIQSILKTSVAGGYLAKSDQIAVPRQYENPDLKLKIPTAELKNSEPAKLEMKGTIAQPNSNGIDLSDKKTDLQFIKQIEKLPVMLLKQEAVGNTVTRNTYVENTNASFIRELPINQKNILEVDNIAVSNLTNLIRQQVDDVIKSTLATDLVDVVEGEDMRPLKKISVQLFPRSLGVVEVNITNIGGKIKIVIETTSTKAESILRAEMPLIMEKSIASGIAIEETLVRINQDLERSPTNNDLSNFKQTDINSSSSQEKSRNKFLDVGIENEFESSSNELNDDSPIKTGLYL